MAIVDILGFLLGMAVIIMVVRPIAQAASDWLRKSANKLEVSDADTLQKRVISLESEVQELKWQLKQVQESTEFMSNYIETAKKEAARLEQKKES